MANLILAYPNRADTATLSGGSWSSSLPLTNLHNRLLSKAARSNDLLTASTQFDVDFGQIRPTRIVVLVSHNLSVSAQWRIRGSNIAGDFVSPEYDSGWTDIWPAIYASVSLEWEDDNFWDGKLSEEEREGFTANGIHVLPDLVRAQYWCIEISDPTNADGYVEIGRLFMSGQWQVETNFNYGASLGYESLTQVEQALGGVEHFDEQPNFRVFRFTLENLSYDSGHQLALDVSRRLGISGEVFIVPDPDDNENMLRRAFLGRLRNLSPIEYPYFDVNTAAFEVKELI